MGQQSSMTGILAFANFVLEIFVHEGTPCMRMCLHGYRCAPIRIRGVPFSSRNYQCLNMGDDDDMSYV
jgi:hypothetical protein